MINAQMQSELQAVSEASKDGQELARFMQNATIVKALNRQIFRSLQAPLSRHRTHTHTHTARPCVRPDAPPSVHAMHALAGTRTHACTPVGARCHLLICADCAADAGQASGQLQTDE
jgi:hypothetical protein